MVCVCVTQSGIQSDNIYWHIVPSSLKYDKWDKEQVAYSVYVYECACADYTWNSICFILIGNNLYLKGTMWNILWNGLL